MSIMPESRVLAIYEEAVLRGSMLSGRCAVDPAAPEEEWKVVDFGGAIQHNEGYEHLLPTHLFFLRPHPVLDAPFGTVHIIPVGNVIELEVCDA